MSNLSDILYKESKITYLQAVGAWGIYLLVPAPVRSTLDSKSGQVWGVLERRQYTTVSLQLSDLHRGIALTSRLGFQAHGRGRRVPAAHLTILGRPGVDQRRGHFAEAYVRMVHTYSTCRYTSLVAYIQHTYTYRTICS